VGPGSHRPGIGRGRQDSGRARVGAVRHPASGEADSDHGDDANRGGGSPAARRRVHRGGDGRRPDQLRPRRAGRVGTDDRPHPSSGGRLRPDGLDLHRPRRPQAPDWTHLRRAGGRSGSGGPGSGRTTDRLRRPVARPVRPPDHSSGSGRRGWPRSSPHPSGFLMVFRPALRRCGTAARRARTAPRVHRRGGRCRGCAGERRARSLRRRRYGSRSWRRWRRPGNRPGPRSQMPLRPSVPSA